jgi:hypothetical protein
MHDFNMERHKLFLEGVVCIHAWVNTSFNEMLASYKVVGSAIKCPKRQYIEGPSNTRRVNV